MLLGSTVLLTSSSVCAHVGFGFSNSIAGLSQAVMLPWKMKSYMSGRWQGFEMRGALRLAKGSHVRLGLRARMAGSSQVVMLPWKMPAATSALSCSVLLLWNSGVMFA